MTEDFFPPDLDESKIQSPWPSPPVNSSYDLFEDSMKHHPNENPSPPPVHNLHTMENDSKEIPGKYMKNYEIYMQVEYMYIFTQYWCF